MGALLKLVRDVRDVADIPAVLNDDPWAGASDAQRRVAVAAEQLLRGLDNELGAGRLASTLRQELTAALVGAGGYAPLAAAARQAGFIKNGKVVSAPTIKRAILAYRKQGKTGLMPKYKGRVRQTRGWEAAAVENYNLPGKPGFADVTSRLIELGFTEVTEDRVARYLKAMPATLGKFSPARVGPHLHRLKRQKFQRRSLDEVLVGEIYAGDGHTCDCYVGHPNTGKPFRPELTAFIDIKSGYIAGVWFTESESAVSTLFALSHSMRLHNHVPAWLYLDHGAGYRARMLSDETTGFFARFDISTIAALPGNPHGKGWIERWFRTVRDKHDKFFAGGLVYCGDDMAQETNRRLSADLNKKVPTRQLPTLAEYVKSFMSWLEHYHQQPQDKLQGRTPAQVWATLTPVGVELDMSSVVRPREECTVGRQTVRLHNRFYYAEALALFDAKRLQVEYDLFDDSRVWVFDAKGRFLTEAKLVNTIGVLPTSRLEEGRDRRKQGQFKRLERRLDEVRQRRDDPITAETQIAGIESLGSPNPPALAPPVQLLPASPTAAPVQSADVFQIDLTTWRKDL